MVFDSADSDGVNAKVTASSNEIGVSLFADVVFQKRFPTFGGKNDVEVYLCKGLRHYWTLRLTFGGFSIGLYNAFGVIR